MLKEISADQLGTLTAAIARDMCVLMNLFIADCHPPANHGF